MGAEISSLIFAGMPSISQQQEMLTVTNTAMVSHCTVFEVSLAHDIWTYTFFDQRFFVKKQQWLAQYCIKYKNVPA